MTSTSSTKTTSKTSSYNPLDHLFLPQMSNEDTTITTSEHHFIFDDLLKPEIFREFQEQTGQTGWQAAYSVQSRMVGCIKKLQVLLRMSHRKNQMLQQENRILSRELFANAERNGRLLGILQDEGIEVEESALEGPQESPEETVVQNENSKSREIKKPSAQEDLRGVGENGKFDNGEWTAEEIFELFTHQNDPDNPPDDSGLIDCLKFLDDTTGERRLD